MQPFNRSRERMKWYNDSAGYGKIMGISYVTLLGLLTLKKFKSLSVGGERYGTSAD